MQILVVTSTYPTPDRPQQGAFNRVMVDALRRNHRVAVIAPVPWTQLGWQETVSHLFGFKKSASCDGETHYPVSCYPPKIVRSQYHHFYWHSMRHRLAELPCDFQPDVVLGYWLHPDGDAAVRCGRHFGVPAVVMSGGTDLRILTQNTKRRKAITRVIEAADRLVVVSRDLGRQAESLGTPPNKIEVVFRGVDQNCFSPGDRMVARAECGVSAIRVLLLWVGRLEAVKNPMMLLRAAVQWQQYWETDFRLLIVGEGSMRRSMEKFCHQYGLGECVRWEGSLSQAELAVRYRAADATVLTSDSEGTPNVLMESIACGTRFVATDVGGVRDIATHGVDRLVAADDDVGMAQAMIELIESGEHDRQRDFVPTDTAGMAKQIEQVFDRVIGSRAEQPGAAERFDRDGSTGRAGRRRAS